MSDLDGVADGLPNHHRPGSCPTTRRRTASADSHPTKSLGMHSLLLRLDLVPELLVGLAPAILLQSCRWLADMPNNSLIYSRPGILAQIQIRREPL